MKSKKQAKNSTLESVKIRKELVEQVRLQKEKTRIPIGAFVEMAIAKELERISAETN